MTRHTFFLLPLALPEEDEECDSGHSSSGHGSLETTTAAAIASAIAGKTTTNPETTKESPKYEERPKIGSMV